MKQNENTIIHDEILNAIDNNPKRLETESFEDYKLRRNISNYITKSYLKGRPVKPKKQKTML